MYALLDNDITLLGNKALAFIDFLTGHDSAGRSSSPDTNMIAAHKRIAGVTNDPRFYTVPRA